MLGLPIQLQRCRSFCLGTIPTFYRTLDHVGTYFVVQVVACIWLPWSTDLILGKSWIDMYHEDGRDVAEAALAAFGDLLAEIERRGQSCASSASTRQRRLPHASETPHLNVVAHRSSR